MLLLVYSLGMGIPFLAFAWAYARAGRTFRFLQRRGPAIERLGGVLLLVMGVLLVTGGWQRLFTPLVRWLVRSGWPPI
jgi:cytochrome c-type biogenesis protein